MKRMLGEYKAKGLELKRKRKSVTGECSEKQKSLTGEISNVGVVENAELPHFLIIGAQKAGTMAAVTNLNKHSDISVLKEMHFFDLAWSTKTPAWYREQLRTDQIRTGKRIIGEKTPEYIYVDACVQRIKSVCPHAKFLLFLRDPVQRAYSSWNMTTNRRKEHKQQQYKETRSFDECIDANIQNLDEYRSFGTAEYHYIQRGFYYDQIQRFLSHFPRDQLFIVISEHVQKEPALYYEKIFEFLGVKNADLAFEDEHVGSYDKSMRPKVKRRLIDLYKPHNEKLFEFLGYRIPEWEYDERGEETERVRELGVLGAEGATLHGQPSQLAHLPDGSPQQGRQSDDHDEDEVQVFGDSNEGVVGCSSAMKEPKAFEAERAHGDGES